MGKAGTGVIDGKAMDKRDNQLSYSVFIVADNKGTAEELRENFSKRGVFVDTVQNRKQVLLQLKQSDFFFSIIILVWLSMRHGTALDFVRQIRKVSDVPILVVAKDEEAKDRIDVLDSGADDYVASPFSLSELTARVENITKRGRRLAFKDTVIIMHDLRLDIKEHTVRMAGQPVFLTRTEYLILEYLLLNKNAFLSKTEIEARVFPSAQRTVSHLLNTHILHLRKKLGANFSIKTKPHRGFMIGE